MADGKKKLYLKIDGSQYGPVSPDTVKRWIEESRFGPNDYLRQDGQNTWIQAKDVTSINSLFHKYKKGANVQNFDNWAQARGEIESEKSKIESERVRLAKEQKSLEASAQQAELTKEKAAEIEKRRVELAKQADQLERDAAELIRTEASLKQRKKRQTLIVGAIIAVVVIVGTWLTIDLIGQQNELEERITQLDERLLQIDNRLMELDDALARAQAEGNVELVAELEAEQEALLSEREETAEMLEEITGEERRADTPDVDGDEAETSGRTGRIAVSGSVQITGEGASDPARSQNQIAAAVSSALGSARSAYNALLADDPTATGSVKIIFTINPDGSVSGVTGSNNTLPQGNLFGTILGGVRGLSFNPIEGGAAKVNYPVSLTPQ
ncbi:AgmX/PglI C-terminal domain-containing protein [bacterium]|nr:AgmX/PglI C-terminal domain-containing protein [bacterium]